MADNNWYWAEGTLFDARGNTLAVTRSSGLETGLEITDELREARTARLLLERAPGSRFSMRATTAGGEIYRCRQTGLSITRLRAQCGANSYMLDRPNPFKRERRIYNDRGQELVRTTPQRGRLVITDGSDLPAIGGISEVDLVFITYCCNVVDIPQRVLRA